VPAVWQREAWYVFRRLEEEGCFLLVSPTKIPTKEDIVKVWTIDNHNQEVTLDGAQVEYVF